jgi:hypothetical protein
VTEGRQITSAADALRFAMAGNARLTLVSAKTGERFTYRVRQRDGKPHFVSVMRGSDNAADYKFIGTVFADRGYVPSRRSSFDWQSPPQQAFGWFWRRLAAGRISPLLEVWHEGRCGRCGRALTVPSSIALGIGPECASAMGLDAAPAQGTLSPLVITPAGEAKIAEHMANRAPSDDDLRSGAC